jgi:hypothetical protein
MNILELLGLKKSSAPAQTVRVSPAPAQTQNTCCGSCGGQGHGNRDGQGQKKESQS